MSDIIKLKRDTKLNIRLKTPFEEYMAEQNPVQDNDDDENREPEIDISEQLDEAYRNGFAEGTESARNELTSQYQTALEDEINKYKYLLEEVNNKFAEYGQQFDEAVVQLSFALAEKIIEREITKDNNLLEIVKQSIKKILGANNVVVKLNPADLDTFDNEARKFINADSFSNLKFEADISITTGGCFIESEIGNVDARISTRLAELKRLFEDSVQEDV